MWPAFGKRCVLSPPAPAIIPRLVSEGGIELSGKHVPEGVELAANPYLVHQDRNIFGDDADLFRPDRWLESRETEREYLKHILTFGYGSRICLGQHVAFMELYKGPLQFLRTFNPKLRDPDNPAKYQISGGISYFEDMWISIEKRASSG